MRIYRYANISELIEYYKDNWRGFTQGNLKKSPLHRKT